MVTINQIEDAAKLADTISSYFNLKISDKQLLLECIEVNERLEKALSYIENENNVLQVEKRIRTRVKRQMEKTKESII